MQQMNIDLWKICSAWVGIIVTGAMHVPQNGRKFGQRMVHSIALFTPLRFYVVKLR